MRLRATRAGGWTLPLAFVLAIAALAVVADRLQPEPAAAIRFAAGAITIGALLLGARRHGCKPRWAWLLLAAGIGVWIVGDFLWDSLSGHGVDPGSAWFVLANCLYAISYPALFAAIVGLVGEGLRGSFENTADSATFALATVLLIRMFAVDTHFTGNTVDTVFNAVWPLGDALLLGGVMWIFFTVGAKNAPLWLLTAGALMMLVTDVAWDLEFRYELRWLDAWIDPAYPIAYAVIAAAALHPDVGSIAVQRRPASRYVHRARLTFLCATLAVVTVVALFGNRRDVLLDVCTVGLVAVIGVRFAALVRAIERAYRTAERSERRFRALATAVPVGIIEANSSMRVVFANEESERQFGMSTVGYQPHQLRHILADSLTEHERAAVDQGIADVIQGRRANAQVRVRDLDGGERWLAWYAIPAGDAPNSGAFLATVDITALKDAESMLSLQATHDALTGLPNRRLLFDRLSQSLRGLERKPGTIAVLFMDLDRFKPVNDDLGHDAGDRLLQVVAGRIQSVVRGTDTVARVGGDEFVIVLSRLSTDRAAARVSAARVAALVVEAVEQPVDLEAGRASVAASIGVALTSEPHEDPDGLLRDADAAMYLAKRSGGCGYTFFDEAVGSPQAAQRLVARRHHRGLPHSSAS